LMATGQNQEEFLEQLRETATKSVRSDLALRAVIAQEAIEADDTEVDAEIERLAERTGEKATKIRKDLERDGLIGAVRSDLARGKALTFLIEHANVVDVDGNPVDLTPPEAPTVETPEEDPKQDNEESAS
ncbi:MAG: hypothetical protein ABW211_05275, partial [Acidimicrobiia bacterium]